MQTNYKQRFSNENSNGRKQSSNIKVGDILSLKINALGPKKIGFVELNNGLTLLVPNTNLGDVVKVTKGKHKGNSEYVFVFCIPQHRFGFIHKMIFDDKSTTSTHIIKAECIKNIK